MEQGLSWKAYSYSAVYEILQFYAIQRFIIVLKKAHHSNVSWTN
jgi:hypothetical protein